VAEQLANVHKRMWCLEEGTPALEELQVM